jgi:low affinity Fe/Cu permease
MSRAFDAAAQRAAAWAGSAWFFALNLLVVLAWLLWGLTQGFTDTLQLVMTTGLTVTTQLLVILIQATQNRDGRAIHLKLDELLRAQREARTELVRAEELSAGEIEERIEEIKDALG